MVIFHHSFCFRRQRNYFGHRIWLINGHKTSARNSELVVVWRNDRLGTQKECFILIGFCTNVCSRWTLWLFCTHLACVVLLRRSPYRCLRNRLLNFFDLIDEQLERVFWNQIFIIYFVKFFWVGMEKITSEHVSTNKNCCIKVKISTLRTISFVIITISTKKKKVIIIIF